MWTIIKFDKKKLDFLKEDFTKKLGKDFIIYNPKLFIQKYKNNKLIKEITPKKAKELIKNKIIKGGMIPKVETCLNAVKKSAKAAVILDGRVPKLLLKEIFTTKGVGTLIGKK